MWLILRKIFRPSSFKAGFLASILLLTLHPGVPVRRLAAVDEFFVSVDERLRDAMFKVRGPQPRPKAQVVIVDIDEKSISAFGQWPWPRNILATIVRRLEACGPKAIGFDIVFAEPDRTSLYRALPPLAMLAGKAAMGLEEWKRLPDAERMAVAKRLFADLFGLAQPPADATLDHDLEFVEAIRAAPRAVLGFFFQMEDDGLKDAENPAVPYGAGIFVARTPPGVKYASPFQARGIIPYRPILNFPLLDEAAEERCGCFNCGIRESGIVRRVPLVWEYEGSLYPALSLQMIRLAENEPQGLVMVDELGVDSIWFRNRVIPTDAIGRIYVNFRGPTKTYEYISASDIHDGRFAVEQVRDRYVLIGSSAGGLLDLRATPFDDAFPGVEIHATIIDNILCQDYITSPSWGFVAELMAMLVGCWLLTAILTVCRPLAGIFLSLLTLAAMLGASYALMFRHHLLLNVSYPLVAGFAIMLLVTALNYFFEGRQRRYISGVFSRYLAPELVRQLAEKPEMLTLEGTQKNLTVLFSDIRDFTAISEKMPARALSAFLNEYLTPMTAAILERRGTVDKFIGDAIMAFWGAPLDEPAHALYASRAALVMVECLAGLQPRWQARGLPLIRIGMGINTGVMSVGNMGSVQRFNYTVMGDNVNLASRLEGLNKIYGTTILISASTRQAIGEGFFCRIVDRVRVKGRSAVVAVYELLCEGDPPPALRLEVALGEEAIAAYQQRDFSAAARLFGDLHSRYAHRLYGVYLERVRHYLTHPPPSDWDGVYEATEK